MAGEESKAARRLLVIDDDVLIRQSIRRQLKDIPGLDIDFEHDPLEGLRRLGVTRYDLVMCDIKMKPMNGLEVLSKVKRLYPALPVIILTGFVDDQMIESAQRLGCSDFLIKPVRKNDLIDAIVRILKTR